MYGKHGTLVTSTDLRMCRAFLFPTMLEQAPVKIIYDNLSMLACSKELRRRKLGYCNGVCGNVANEGSRHAPQILGASPSIVPFEANNRRRNGKDHRNYGSAAKLSNLQQYFGEQTRSTLATTVHEVRYRSLRAFVFVTITKHVEIGRTRRVCNCRRSFLCPTSSEVGRLVL